MKILFLLYILLFPYLISSIDNPNCEYLKNYNSQAEVYKCTSPINDCLLLWESSEINTHIYICTIVSTTTNNPTTIIPTTTTKTTRNNPTTTITPTTTIIRKQKYTVG